MKTIAKGLACVLGAWILILVAPGASQYVRDHLASFFGVFFLVAMAAFLVYAFYELFSAPIRRALRSLGDRIEYTWHRKRVRREIERRALSTLEEQRVRMLSLSARVYEQAAGALSDGKLLHELENLRAESERVLLRAQSHEIERYILRYEIALTQLSNSPNMSAAEKVRALRQI